MKGTRLVLCLVCECGCRGELYSRRKFIALGVFGRFCVFLATHFRKHIRDLPVWCEALGAKYKCITHPGAAVPKFVHEVRT